MNGHRWAACRFVYRYRLRDFVHFLWIFQYVFKDDDFVINNLNYLVESLEADEMDFYNT